MFLGIKIIQDKEGISLQQSHYVQQILQKYGMENCKEVPTPGSKEINLDNHIEDDNCDQHTYQEALGMLMFLAVNTRPDIAYITSKLSQYSRQPKQMHWTAIKRVMRYLRGTIDLGVKFERGKTGILKSYTDASWSTTHDGKSYGGYVLKLGEATIDWKSNKQPLVALSTMEAEMIAACESCCQIKWIINLLRELEEWNFMKKPTAIYTDSQSLINWISNPKQSSCCIHINRKHHFLRDCYESRDICLLYKPSQDLEADIFTKDLSRDQMKKHLENLSIVGIKTNLLRDIWPTQFLDKSRKAIHERGHLRPNYPFLDFSGSHWDQKDFLVAVVTAYSTLTSANSAKRELVSQMDLHIIKTSPNHAEDNYEISDLPYPDTSQSIKCMVLMGHGHQGPFQCWVRRPVSEGRWGPVLIGVAHGGVIAVTRHLPFASQKKK
ncbi:hypothetical protein LAZ67_8003997 [Cordylochernes scorpioides]|uniref:Uncharacterized protein n=1 Tax=Cordylochernes scorpioides TaxID=51811 RepID=A0ABY6KSK1_9ARAC|nr:hypothetical protein LAZ67_8003997 [Cordylochernes scorpioides]